MTAIELGYRPAVLRVLLSRGADFGYALRSTAGALPAGAVVELVFDVGITWTATIVSDLIQWSKTDAQVGTLLDARPVSVTLWYRAGGVDVPWARGAVEIT